MTTLTNRPVCLRRMVLPFLLLLVFAATTLLAGCDDSGDDAADGDGVDGDQSGTQDGFDLKTDFGPAKRVAIYYEHDDTDQWSQGKQYAVEVYNLVGHFNTSARIINVDDYSEGDLDNYDAVIYLGTQYDYPLSNSFLRDAYNNEDVPFFWINSNIWQFFYTDGWDAESRFGFNFIEIAEEEPFNRIDYKDETLRRHDDDMYVNVIDVTDSKCKTWATIKKSSESGSDIPYAVQCDNFFYLADNPFTYLFTGYLVFADLLHELLDTDTKTSLRAVIRFEDLAPGNVDNDKLREQADKLHERGIPFSMGVIPVHTDPEGVWGDPGKTVKLHEDQDFIDTINYMIDKGGVVSLHGYTHQYEGITGVDYEFWDEVEDAPVPDDSYDWALQRVDDAISEYVQAMGEEPMVWETPHYSASPSDYFAIASRFNLVFERVMTFDSLQVVEPGEAPDFSDVTYSTQDFPYQVFNSFYGFRILPENMGYLDDQDDVGEYGILPNPEGIETYGRMYSVVRDSVVSFFYHHWQPFDDCLDAIDRLEALGYEFVDIREIANEYPPGSDPQTSTDGDTDGDTTDGDTTDGDFTKPDGDTVDGDSTVTDGDLIFPTIPNNYGNGIGEACPNGPIDCQWTLGCHLGVCGNCTTADECREYEGCLDSGACGRCTANSQCPSDQSCREGFCTVSVLPRWDIEIAPEDLSTMLNDIWEDTYFPIVLTVDGKRYDNGEEIRPYGNSSRIYPKKSFRIKFPEDVDQPGYSRKINLRADYNDPSFMRTFLAYETYRRLTNVPAPRARFIKLYINGDYHGVMIETQRIGPSFLEEHGRNRSMSLYEAEEIYDPGAMLPLDSTAEYMTIYNKKAGNDEDYSDVKSLVEDVIWADYEDSNYSSEETVTTRIRKNIDVQMKIDYLALQAVIQNIDHVSAGFHFSYQYGPQQTMRWEFYPHDADISFGCQYDEEELNGICDDMYDDEFYLPGIIPEDMVAGEESELWINLLIHLIFRDSELRSIYDRRICEMLDSDYWNVDLPKMIDAFVETLADSVVLDENDMNDSRADFEAAAEEIKTFLGDRKDFLQNNSYITCP